MIILRDCRLLFPNPIKQSWMFDPSGIRRSNFYPLPLTITHFGIGYLNIHYDIRILKFDLCLILEKGVA